MPRPHLVFLALALLATPAVAQEGRFVDPQPVNFDRPFLFDGVRARERLPGPVEESRPRAQPVPIDVWLANGRTLEGLGSKLPPPPAMEMDAESLRNLFRNLLPAEKAPSPDP